MSFAANTDLTYDILRAIAFELNNGYSFEETLSDLNISKECTPKFDVTVLFADGTKSTTTNERIDLYSVDEECLWFYVRKGSENKGIRLDFRPCDVVFDLDHAEITLAPDKIERYVDEDDFNIDNEESRAMYEYMCNIPIVKVVFTRKNANPMMKYIV